MGYQTVKKVPAFIDYANALRWWDNTKPIRGRSVDLRPLAERRHADSYSIRKRGDGAIECVLYQTPVVTITPNNIFEVRNSGWVTASTHMFIEEVMGTGIKVSGQRGKTIIRVDGHVLALGANEVLRFERVREHGVSKFKPLETQTHYAYRINRKGANIVRTRFKEFYGYFKAFMKLRGEESQGNYYGEMRFMVHCTFSEIADCLGAKDYWDTNYVTVSTDDWRALTMKPGTYSGYRKAPRAEYEEAVQKFLALIASDQPEETKHTNFHKATIVLLTHNHTNIVEKKTEANTRTVWLDVMNAGKTLDTALFKWFAPEVLERYEVPKGKVPETKYNSWMEGENT